MPESTEDLHACLSPSSASKWINCPYWGSKHLQKNGGQQTVSKDDGPITKSNKATRLGTMAHALGEKVLKRYVENGNKTVTLADGAGIKDADALLDAEVVKDVQEYVNFCVQKIEAAKAVDPNLEVHFEEELDMSKYIPPNPNNPNDKGGFGTSDFMMIYGNTIHVIDYKNGVKPVSAVENPQERIYALGAIEKYKKKFPNLSTVVMGIVQPNVETTEDKISVAALENWGNTVVKPAVEKIYSGDMTQTPGKWCKDFCEFYDNNNPSNSKCQASAKAAGEATIAVDNEKSTSSKQLDKRPVYTPYVNTYNRTKTANGFVESAAFLKRYYSMIDAEVFFNNHYVEDIRMIDWGIQQQTQPLYGYNSFTYDEMAQGARIVQGQFTINFSSPNYLFKILEAAAKDNQKIELMKSYVIKSHYRKTVGHYGYQTDPALEATIAGKKTECLWPQTFDIDAIFGQKTGTGNPVHIIIRGVKLTSSNIGISADGAGNPCIMETYTFYGRDIKTIA